MAGKFAEKAWEAGERWLRTRFQSHAAATVESARKNAAEFVTQLAARVESLEQLHLVDSEQVAATERHPQFSILLQSTLINAAQTCEADKHDLLARLIAARLAAGNESTLALASDMASDAITRSTKRQLRMMALCCFLEEVRPIRPIPIEEFRRWVDNHLKKLSPFDFKEIDSRHLVALGCVTYEATSGRGLEALLWMKGNCVGESFAGSDLYEELDFAWGECLGGTTLTSVGSIVGGLALDQIYGRDLGLPTWANH